jgi:hypothetical protein
MAKSLNQRIFDKVAMHLLEQGARAEDAGLTCQYRGSNNTKCAVGCLIQKKHYDPKLEGKTIDESTKGGQAVRRAVCASLGVDRLPKDTVELLGDLQGVHDGEDVADWESELANVATKHGLNDEVLS